MGERDILLAEDENVKYARECMRDCVTVHGDSPYVSHLLLTQEGALDDGDPLERQLGIKAGLEWKRKADATVVYFDRGITSGMLWGIRFASELGQPIEYRQLGGSWAIMEIAAMSIDEMIAELKSGA